MFMSSISCWRSEVITAAGTVVVVVIV